MPSHSNHLVGETSPYLLQHAHNPVEWYPWGEEALQKARKENKPILVSIGYSACHWCHVMERESFEDEATAGIMNEHFVNIKIDREERPDLDHIYMDAVQAMTGSGGWPLNVFLTPEGKPFYGGTYFPPKNAFNRPSWQETLLGIKTAFHERRHEIDAQAENLTDHLVSSNAFGIQPAKGNDVFTADKLDTAVSNILATGDTTWGGFGKAPKFPQTFTIQFLLRHYNETAYAKNEAHAGEAVPLRDRALQQALLSLDKMIEGGIYDQAGGGFARYATDTEWLIPHFEKMLYDNALLVSVLSEAFQLTGIERYREVIDETIAFVLRELSWEGKAFYAALDADSEGEEGRFYVWDYKEVKGLLEDDADVFCDYYDITPRGNWEGKNILRVKVPVEKYAESKGISQQVLREILERGKEKLMVERMVRIRPSLDDKIILGWNALMNTAVSKAYAATGKEAYRQLALDNMRFILDNLKQQSGAGAFHHTWKDGKAKFPAFLDDYAFLIQALIQLQEITGDTGWLLEAEKITQLVLTQFSDEETQLFFYTPAGQADVIVRKKEVYDSAVPSGNSVMAYNLYHLSLLFDRPEWQERSRSMVGGLEKIIIKYPGSFAVWATLFQEIIKGTNELAVTGKTPESLHKTLLAAYIPHRILMVAKEPSKWPLLNGKQLGDETNIWLCHNYACRLPVIAVADLIALINSAKAAN
ncbi:MAG TPA: thioredoxin domain-containing protein [Chitinophagaceae bacterium]